MLKTPVLFIIFNRPETTSKVFEIIRKMKPLKLFIAADGPRDYKTDEDLLCAKTRKITENIDWKCKVYRLYRKSNLGCGVAVSGAIDWFFANVENGIILEDDCLPNEGFFSFAENMLSKYKDDPKFMHISGDNFMQRKYQNKNIYLNSKYPHVWGWATWRRAWQKYDFNMTSWKNKSLLQKFNSISGNVWDKLYWVSKFDSVAYKITDTWDYQWVYTLFKNNAMCIVPGVNMISNIGFGPNSTHTADQSNTYANFDSYSLNKKYFAAKKSSSSFLDEYERKHVFNVTSFNTIMFFAYFSIFCMLYNKK